MTGMPRAPPERKHDPERVGGHNPHHGEQERQRQSGPLVGFYPGAKTQDAPPQEKGRYHEVSHPGVEESTRPVCRESTHGDQADEHEDAGRGPPLLRRWVEPE